MKWFFAFSIFTFIASPLLAQLTEITMFPYTDQYISEAKPIALSSSQIMLTYVQKDSLRFSISNDSGISWQTPKHIEMVSSLTSFAALKTNSGRIIIIWATAVKFNKIFSDDSGLNWSVPEQIGGTVFNSKNLTLTQTNDNTLWLCHSRAGNLYYVKSTDNGNSWAAITTFMSTGKNTFLSVNSTSSGKLIALYQDNTSGNQDILIQSSTDNGITWFVPIHLAYSNLNEEKPMLVKTISGTLWIVYQIQKQTPFIGINQYDIHYMKSIDEGSNWAPSIQFTKYVDDDILSGTALINNKPFLSLLTKRFSQNRVNQVASAIIGETTDLTPPPVIFKLSFSPPSYNEPLIVQAYVHDDNGIAEVKLEIIGGNTIFLYDDGSHNDLNPNDFIYGNTLQPSDFYFGNAIIVNNIKLPLNRQGVLADVSTLQNNVLHVKDLDDKEAILPSSISFGAGGRFAEAGFLFAGGFMLSGYSNNFMWANGIATASRINDYQAGIVGSSPTDPKNKLYLIRRTDPHFGSSWQAWLDAVLLGAYFYDGDNDGMYNPIDKNSNGKWDPDEDMPDILGDETFWCVYNDGVPASQRRFNDVPPQGIEVRQTVFASKRNPNLENVIFIRYSFLNKGTVANKLDSVYFGIWTDPDLGDYTDDLVGSDTLLNSGFCYNNGDDKDYGINPPAFFTTILQGPWVYSGSPTDTAFNNRGQILGQQTFPGYKNQNMSSYIHYFSSVPPFLNDPSNRFDARNYMLGYNKLGQLINPCTWTYGEVRGGVNCALINPKFLYSGDPVTNIGWITNHFRDQRMMLNVGPFELQLNNPIDIVIAYTLGRGTNHLNSITQARNLTSSVLNEYRSNFSRITNIEDETPLTIPSEFKLYQNYPNPFNPSTTIKFSIPHFAFVTLKVYDILGREVATLVDEVKEAGTYSVEFSSQKSVFSSGIYFYTLRAGEYAETKKMMIIK